MLILQEKTLTMLYHEESDQSVEEMVHPAPTESFNLLRVRIILKFHINNNID